MAELKTKRTEASVDAYVDAIPDEVRRKDCRAVIDIMRKATKAEPKMWGPAIIGFGDHHYKYDSGRELDWFLTGFASRKTDLTLYIMPGFARYEELMRKLGKHKIGKSCLYLKRLSDVDVKVLAELVSASVKHMKAKKA